MFYSRAYDLTEYVVLPKRQISTHKYLLKNCAFAFSIFKLFLSILNLFLSLLLGSSEDHLVPVLVNGLRGYHIIDVACGSGDAHSLAVADDGGCIGILHWHFLELVHSKPVLSFMNKLLEFSEISFCLWRFLP